MGQAFRKARKAPPQGILLVGLDAGGKTTIIFKLSKGLGSSDTLYRTCSARRGSGEPPERALVVVDTPAFGFNVETLEYTHTSPGREFKFKIACWDVSGPLPPRPPQLCRDYYQALGEEGKLVFVVDSNDRDYLGDDAVAAAQQRGMARHELHKLLDQDDLCGMPLLVFANKQDLPGALSAAEVTERLGLEELRDRPWHVQACCATTGDGLQEGLDWLATGVRAGSAVAVPAAEEVVVAEEAPAAGKAAGGGGGGDGGGAAVAATAAAAVGVGGVGAAGGKGSSSSSSSDDDDEGGGGARAAPAAPPLASDSDSLTCG